MSYFDIILIAIVACFALYGFWLGFVNAVGGLVGLFFGTWLAGNYYGVAASWLSPYISNEGTAKIVGFILIFLVVNKGVGIIFSVINSIFRLPLLNSINHFFGAALGLVEGLLAIGLFLFVASRFSISPSLNSALTSSEVAKSVIALGNLLAPLLPDLLNKLKAVI
jgi:uncharacterized membrane protein required for colicin V production